MLMLRYMVFVSFRELQPISIKKECSETTHNVLPLMKTMLLMSLIFNEDLLVSSLCSKSRVYRAMWS